MARVRSKDNALKRLLGSAPVAVYALDEQRRIIYCNKACGELLAVEPDELLGQQCDYRCVLVGTSASDLAARLCPPPDVMTGSCLRVEMTLLRASGELVDCHVQFATLGNEAVPSAGVLATVYPRAAGVRQQSDDAPESTQLHQRLLKLRESVSADLWIDELIGESPAIQRVRAQIELASRGGTRVLVHGPGGSGREHVARLLHRQASPDPFSQLVPLCCPLLDAELLQSTITALVRHADAHRGRDARGEGSGWRVPTLLLLEVDQLVEEAQVELSGFLSLPDFELNSIATAEQSLVMAARQDRFHPDLAHALSTLTIHMPPLSQRPEDIPLLCQYYVERFNAEGGRQLAGFTSEALDELAGYAWPENIDELAELVEAACRSSHGPVLDVGDLPAPIRWAAAADAHPRRVDEPIDLDQFLAGIEQELMRRAMQRSKGNKTKAARLLGVNRARFLRRWEQFKG